MPKIAAATEEIPSAVTLADLAAMAAECQRCPLFRNATQTVFGEGSPSARIMLVGEQPGDQEDRAGRPFVGPAGHVLDEALAAAGLDRAKLYITNAVKHFKNVPRGKRRLHQKPNTAEIVACRWWLSGEMALVKPALVVALGANAARALFGRTVRISAERGAAHDFGMGFPGMVTMHPSAILRMPDPTERDAAFKELTRDLRSARSLAYP